MLLTKTVKIKLTNNIKYYEDLGYKIPRRKNKKGKLSVPANTEIEIRVEDLPKGSHAIVQWQCDGENCGEIINGKYQDYLKCVKEDGKIYCNTCSKNNGKFYSVLQWAIDNNRLIELNLRKNYELGIDLNKISYKSSTTIWCLCIKKDYHNDFGGYPITVSKFTDNKGCPYCASKKVHPLDSLAQYIIDKYSLEFFNKVWNWEKNNELGINPWEITPSSHEEVWWNCLYEKHPSFKRSCDSSKFCKYRCPECYEPPKGENSPCWKHDKTQKERSNDRSSFEYNQFVKDVMARDNYTCQITGVISNGHNLVVHHIDGYNWCKEKRTNVDNGIVLCKQIHKLFHKLYGQGDNTEEQFNEFLELIENGDIDISNIN